MGVGPHNELAMHTMIDKIAEFSDAAHQRPPGEANQAIDDACVNKPQGITPVFLLLRMQPWLLIFHYSAPSFLLPAFCGRLENALSNFLAPKFSPFHLKTLSALRAARRRRPRPGPPSTRTGTPQRDAGLSPAWRKLRPPKWVGHRDPMLVPRFSFRDPSKMIRSIPRSAWNRFRLARDSYWFRNAGHVDWNYSAPRGKARNLVCPLRKNRNGSSARIPAYPIGCGGSRGQNNLRSR